MHGIARGFALFTLIASIASASPQAPQPGVPFKLGTFERNGTPFIGIVLRNTVVVDL